MRTVPHPLIYEAADVAAILGVAVATLRGKWRRLNREHGFPRPLAGRPDAWSRALVDDWVNTDPAERAVARRDRAAARDAAALDRQRSALEARYVGGTHG